MIEPKYYVKYMLETEGNKDYKVYAAGHITSARKSGKDILFTAPLLNTKKRTKGYPARMIASGSSRRVYIRLRTYTNGITRVMLSLDNRQFNDNTPMLMMDKSVKVLNPKLKRSDNGFIVTVNGSVRFKTGTSSLLSGSLSPDGRKSLTFQAEDHFSENCIDSLPAVFMKRKDGHTALFLSFELEPGEHFCGTGERFDRMDLAGRQLVLVNEDARGVNNTRTYKNIPFLMSSRRYGLFMHSSAKMKVDIGQHSTRALQWIMEDEDCADLFIIGGNNLTKVLSNYRNLTGKPQMTPLWSFGSWMSRMTYFSDKEVSGIAARLRKEKYPMDVMHIDTGWFDRDWKCEWKFSKKRFPDPAEFAKRMRKQGFRITLWQYPYIRRDIGLTKIALKNKYVGRPLKASGRITDHVDTTLTLDFTNPAGARWYQGLIGNLMKMGVSAIKTDFGENINENAVYKGVPASKYRNLFSLLYQKAAWEITKKITGAGIIWARSSWAGSQRYPTHWGGDSACTYDGLAGSIQGGLHLGMSGFAFWSHDIAGFHGIPNFMKNKPSQKLYVRWTQFGVFTPHMRYHGTTPREPWEYPQVKNIVREWLKLRYMLIPYIVAESQKCCRNGLPLLKSLVVDWTDDPAVWSISDEYMFGESFLVAPVTNDKGIRNVYLPEGRWVDFWTGRVIEGPAQIKNIKSPLSRMPLYVKYNAKIKFSEPVQCTDELARSKKFSITFNSRYKGYGRSALGKLVKL